MVWAALKAFGALLSRVPWQVWAALAIAAGVMTYGHGRYKTGYAAAEAHYQAIQADRLAEIVKLQQTIRDQEKKHAEALDGIAKSHAAEIASVEERARRDRAAARDGSLKLRVPVSVCAAAGAAQGNESGARVGDGGATVELPRTVTQDLFDLVNDADAVADQLRACQAVIKADRE